MDWQALSLSIVLATVTVAVLLPLGLWCGRTLAFSRWRGKPLLEGLVVLPLVLPPTVFGYYLLAGFAGAAPFGVPLSFSFEGLVLASLLFNVPFMVQPVQRAFEAIPPVLGEAAAVCGLSSWQSFWRVDLPLAWPGVLSGTVLTFVHTLGEFGVVLMVGGNIPGETRTVSIALYDRVQSFDMAGANRLALLLLCLSLLAVAVSYFATARLGRNR